MNIAVSRCSAASPRKTPSENFTPDYGRITTYRSAGGFATCVRRRQRLRRLGHHAALRPLLVKVTTWGSSLEEAGRAPPRAVRVPHPRRQDQHLVPAESHRTPDPSKSGPRRRRSSIRRRSCSASVEPRPRYQDALLPWRCHRQRAVRRQGCVRSDAQAVGARATPGAASRGAARGTRQLLQNLGPEKFAEWIRNEKRLLITDTTLRDAHQSLLATRFRTYDMLAVADAIAAAHADALQSRMGGATYDTSMRFLQEDPWQAARRSPDTRAEHPVPDAAAPATPSATRPIPTTWCAFIKRSAENGIDVFRIFDSLNATSNNMQLAIESVRNDTNASARRPSATPATSSIRRATKHSLRLLREACEGTPVKMGTHILGIKDMAGLQNRTRRMRSSRPCAKKSACRFTSTRTTPAASTRAASCAPVMPGRHCGRSAGVDGRMTSQPCLNGIVAALKNTDRDTGLDQTALDDLSRYWGVVRELYYPFEEGLKAPGPDVYQHEMPGGQHNEPAAAVEEPGAREPVAGDLRRVRHRQSPVGDIVKVTPSSKVVGDLAPFLVTNKAHG